MSVILNIDDDNIILDKKVIYLSKFLSSFIDEDNVLEDIYIKVPKIINGLSIEIQKEHIQRIALYLNEYINKPFDYKSLPKPVNSESFKVLIPIFFQEYTNLTAKELLNEIVIANFFDIESLSILLIAKLGLLCQDKNVDELKNLLQ